MENRNPPENIARRRATTGNCRDAVRSVSGELSVCSSLRRPLIDDFAAGKSLRFLFITHHGTARKPHQRHQAAKTARLAPSNLAATTPDEALEVRVPMLVVAAEKVCQGPSSYSRRHQTLRTLKALLPALCNKRSARTLINLPLGSGGRPAATAPGSVASIPRRFTLFSKYHGRYGGAFMQENPLSPT